MSTPDETSNISETQIFDPFPKTNTMPAGWDLSGLTPDPAPTSATPANDSADTSTP